jgi:hypothetical protein
VILQEGWSNRIDYPEEYFIIDMEWLAHQALAAMKRLAEAKTVLGSVGKDGGMVESVSANGGQADSSLIEGHEQDGAWKVEVETEASNEEKDTAGRF